LVEFFLLQLIEPGQFLLHLSGARRLHLCVGVYLSIYLLLKN
jgi:hypothetical protein